VSLTKPLHSHVQSLAQSASFLVTLAVTTAAVLCSAVAGKDLNFDQLHYHFYLGFSFVEERLGQDFMAASGQSYINPLAYVPFYWMVSQGWHSLVVASVLAAFHSINILLSYHIARTVLQGHRNDSTAIGIAAACLAFVSPVFLMELGTSFADISTATFVLASIWLILRSDQHQSALRQVFAAGVLLGVAGGLKLSNLVFAPACALMILTQCKGIDTKTRTILTVGCGGLVGLLLGHGYWSWRLWNEFGNPFFPMFNSLFASPDYPIMGGSHQRFLPQSALDYLTLPFRMAQVRAWVYIENVAPDLRFAALLLALVSFAVIAIKRRYALESRRTLALLTFFLVGYVLWLKTSGNGRYGIVLSILCGPLFVVVACAVLQKRAWHWSVLIGVFVLHVLHLQNGQIRWSSEPWTATWYEMSVPAELEDEPVLYLVVGGNSNSYAFPFLGSKASFTNPIGQTSIELDGPGGARVSRLLERYHPHVRVLAMMTPSDNSDPSSFEAWRENVNALIDRLGYQVGTDCHVISSSGAGAPAGQDFDQDSAFRRKLRTCRAVRTPPRFEQERQRVKKVVAEVMQWCPKLFQPDYTVVERTPTGWFALFTSTDITLRINGDQLLVDQQRASANIYLGRLSDWEEGVRPDCDKLPTRPRDTYTFH
jgi:hypothetical protein